MVVSPGDVFLHVGLLFSTACASASAIWRSSGAAKKRSPAPVGTMKRVAGSAPAAVAAAASSTSTERASALCFEARWIGTQQVPESLRPVAMWLPVRYAACLLKVMETQCYWQLFL